jgi:hypothetical protein
MLKNIIFWPKATSILKNEEGAVIIAALLILVLLTIVGIASNNISNTEVKIAAHELFHQQNFYRAEGASLIAIKVMEPATAIADMKAKISDPDAGPAWLWVGSETEFTDEIALEGELWEDPDYSDEATPPHADDLSDPLSDTRYLVVYQGAPGESLELGITKRHRFGIYGRSASPRRGSTTIEIGYYKVF